MKLVGITQAIIAAGKRSRY